MVRRITSRSSGLMSPVFDQLGDQFLLGTRGKYPGHGMKHVLQQRRLFDARLIEKALPRSFRVTCPFSTRLMRTDRNVAFSMGQEKWLWIPAGFKAPFSQRILKASSSF